jgi:hypothetical protein
MPNVGNLAILLFIWLVLPSTYHGSAQKVSIASDAGLLQQPDCVQVCMAGSGAGTGHENIVQAVGCGSSDANSCFCGADLRISASNYLSSCLTTDFSACAGGSDYTAAVSIYDRYCSFTGPATAIVTPTPTSGNSDINNIVTVTVSSGPTVTVSSGPAATVTTSSTSSLLPPSVSELLIIVAFTNMLCFAGITIPRR